MNRVDVVQAGRGESTTTGWTDTYDVTGADVLQVVDWAQRQAGSKLTYAVALVQDDETSAQQRSAHGRGLVWLVGRDGNGSSPLDPGEAQALHRMLTRRRNPVGIPPSDRIPPRVSSAYTDGTEHP